MYTRILLPTDGSDRSARAVSAGIQLAKLLNAKVIAIFVNKATYINSIDDVPHPYGDEALSAVAQLAEKHGVPCTCMPVKGDTLSDEIVGIAKDNHCDLIIMGTHGRSKVGKLLLGSIAASVIANCDIPVLLYR